MSALRSLLSAMTFLRLVPLLLVEHHGVIARGERNLAHKFADDYRATNPAFAAGCERIRSCNTTGNQGRFNPSAAASKS
jgi:hypothetical protein